MGHLIMPLVFQLFIPVWWPLPLASGFDYALRQTGAAGLVIIVLLLLLSSFSWAVMITKYRLLSKSGKASQEFLAAYRAQDFPLTLYLRGERFPSAPEYDVYLAGCRELCALATGRGDSDNALESRLLESKRLTAPRMEGVHLTLQRLVRDASHFLESKTSMLATAVSGAPFLGLLGTVWGVMETFGSIAVSSSTASIKDMAPGVSAALVTTAIGLLVAIPAMFGYNSLVGRIRTRCQTLENFAVELAVDFNRWFLDEGRPAKDSIPDWRPAGIDFLSKSKTTERSPIRTGAAGEAEAPEFSED
jgi:biopolymer transport protein ExbB/TolQ